MLHRPLALIGPCNRQIELFVSRGLHRSAVVARSGSSNRSSKSSKRERGQNTSSTAPDPPFLRDGKARSWQKDLPSARTHAGPSKISTAKLVAKLSHLLHNSWQPATPMTRQLADELDVDSHSFYELVAEFSDIAIQELAEITPSTNIFECRFGSIEWLKAATVAEGNPALSRAITQAFFRWIASRQSPAVAPRTPTKADSTLSKLRHIARLVDLRYPGELYADARQKRRKIIMHVGPTNSGKTHSALQALARAKTGVYAGPLRLLAHEIFTRFNEGKIGDQGPRPCNLVTGEEHRVMDPNGSLTSCTVEMFPLSRHIQVGIIDEIQLIADTGRGTAWTTALIGSRCDELHLCGEESVVKLVQVIAKELGDELIVNRYKRLSPLVVAPRSLASDLSKIQPGDCLVTFSRSNIFAFKRLIEQRTKYRVAVAYGGLPPEVREEQARAFNAGEYDVLVASDAVGMGLNLKIKRVVFETMTKWNGKAQEKLPVPQIKQIAGRAGRYGVHSSPTAPDDADASSNTTVGEVTTLDDKDLGILRNAMAQPINQVPRARLEPPAEVFKAVYSQLASHVTSRRIYELVSEMTVTSPHYDASSRRTAPAMFDSIEHVRNLSFNERAQFALAPVNVRDPTVLSTYVTFVEDFAAGKQIYMNEWAASSGLQTLLDQLQDQKANIGKRNAESTEESADPSLELMNPVTLQKLESFHRCLTLYLWLSYRLMDIFCDQEAARTTRHAVEKAIELVLSQVKFERNSPSSRGRFSKRPLKLGYQGSRDDLDESGSTAPVGKVAAFA